MDLVKSVWKATLIKRAAEICFSFLQMLVVSSNFASVGFQFYQAGNYVHWTLTNTENKTQVEYKFKKAFKKVTCKRRGICSKARLPTGQLCSSTSVQTRSETISFQLKEDEPVKLYYLHLAGTWEKPYKELESEPAHVDGLDDHKWLVSLPHPIPLWLWQRRKINSSESFPWHEVQNFFS